MKLLFTRNCRHFAERVESSLLVRPIVKNFSDGELYVKIEEDLADETVWLIASTQPPAESVLELLFILDALMRRCASVNLLLVYCAYARQDRAAAGEAFSAQVFFNLLAPFAIKQSVIVHAHGARLSKLYNFQNYIPYHFFEEAADGVDVICAPDVGVELFAQTIASKMKKEYCVIKKRRLADDEVELVGFDGNVRDKRVLLVDDMITTGNTIISAAKRLQQDGAMRITAATTHAIFSNDAQQRLSKSPIERLFVTNTIAHHTMNSQIQIVNIWPELEKIIFVKN